MSIQSEVSRIDGAKGALKTAIEGKGVAVPEDTRIEGYAALVAEIPQGTGDMLASVYDPQNKAQDVFAYADGKEPLRVVINSDEPLNMTSSHTIAQIKEAYEAGRYVYAEEQGYNAPIPLYDVTDEACRFSQFITDSAYKTLSEYYIELKINDGQEHIGAYLKDVKHLPLAGGTMTGALMLSGAPTADLHAATKKYVDDSVPDITGKADKAVPTAAGNVAALDAEGNLQDSGKPFTAAGIGALPTTGGTMTGAINMHTNVLHLDQSEGSYIQAGEYGHVNIVAPGGLSLDQPLPVGSGGTGAAAASVARANLGAAAESHTHTAAAITGGTLGITRGGTGVTSHTDTTYTTARYRASALVSADTDPTTNGVINWTYE